MPLSQMMSETNYLKSNLEAAKARFNEATPEEFETANEELTRARLLYNGQFSRIKHRQNNK